MLTHMMVNETWRKLGGLHYVIQATVEIFYITDIAHSQKIKKKIDK